MLLAPAADRLALLIGGPVVALVTWTLVMLVWMAIARRTAFAKLGIGWSTIPRGSRGVNLEGKAPAIGHSIIGRADVSRTLLAWVRMGMRFGGPLPPLGNDQESPSESSRKRILH